MKNRGRLGKGVVWVGVNLFEVVKLFIWARTAFGKFCRLRNVRGYYAVNMRCKWEAKSL